jgi:hypothetical protein
VLPDHCHLPTMPLQLQYSRAAETALLAIVM